MRTAEPARLLRVHISEPDRFEGAPLHEAIVALCRERRIAGATVFRGLEGYGGSEELHKSHLVRHHRPVLIVIVDSPPKIEALIPEIERMMDTGLIAVSDVQAIRVEKPQPPPKS
jgi:uncharacterized protein